MSAKTLSFQIVAPLQGWTYHIVMEATPAYSDNTAFSSLDVTALGAVLPNSPSNLVATLTSPTNVFLHWNDNSDNESGFYIYRSTDPTFASNVTKVTTTGADVNEYTDTLPDETTTYYYEVFAATPNGVAAGSGPVANGASPTTLPAGGESVSGAKNGPVKGIGLFSVSFGGFSVLSNGQHTQDFQAVERDDGSGAYAAPQWLDPLETGFVESASWAYIDGTVDPIQGLLGVGNVWQQSFPLSYYRSTKTSPAYIVATPTFTCSNSSVTKFVLKGQGDGYSFGPIAGSVSNGSLTATMNSNQPISLAIDSSTLSITWSISLDGGKTFSYVGASDNHLFVTGGHASTEPETVLWLGCEGAKEIHQIHHRTQTMRGKQAPLKMSHGAMQTPII